LINSGVDGSDGSDGLSVGRAAGLAQGLRRGLPALLACLPQKVGKGRAQPQRGLRLFQPADLLA
jgi:hypothetical protein